MTMTFFDAANDQQTRNFIIGVNAGFLAKTPEGAHLDRLVGYDIASNAHHTAVYANTDENGGSPDPAWGPIPVGTFTRFDGTVNLGSGQTPAALLTNATVRPTQKRRGTLRKMMTANLRAAADSGMKLALLTATSARIYGRFGFRDTVDWGAAVINPQTFALSVKPAGRVEVVSAPWLNEHMPSIFDGFHETKRGSVSRVAGFYEVELGLFDDAGSVKSKFAAAVHLNESEQIDGYVLYWVENDKVLHVVDLIPQTPDAELGLWDFLASVERIEKILWPKAPAEWLLPRALKDRRTVEQTSRSDGLWARVLDPAILSERPYLTDGELDFEVEDPMGFAAGRYKLVVKGGVGTVTQEATTAAVKTDGEAPIASDVPVLSVPALGALLFGSESVRELQTLGLVRGVAPSDLARLDGLFAAPSKAQLATVF